jgi:lipopolysaccharide transport system permease protein
MSEHSTGEVTGRKMSLPVKTNLPITGTPPLGLAEVWANSELIQLFIWRDIKTRYKQTSVGALWAILQPLLTMIIFTLLFGRVVKLSSDGVPYPAFALAALIPWTYIVHGLTKSTISLTANYELITKVYFPRLVIPISAVLAGLMDLAVSFVLLIALFFYYGVEPGLSLLALPVFVVYLVLLTLGMGLWLSALNVEYRDIANALPFVTQSLLFVSPIAYSSSMIPEQWRVIYYLNPVAGVIDGFRWCLTGSGVGPHVGWIVSALVTLFILIGGVFFFRTREERFADVV